MARFVLFPGRHHLLTRFQAVYLRGLVKDEEAQEQSPEFRTTCASSNPGATIVWAVTSANHQNTKRNPVAYDRREAAIERFSVQEGLRSLVVPVFDTAHTDRFAEVTLKSVESVLGHRLTPQDTVVACSTPEVAALYSALGFEIAPVEADPAHSRSLRAAAPTSEARDSGPTDATHSSLAAAPAAATPTTAPSRAPAAFDSPQAGPAAPIPPANLPPAAPVPAADPPPAASVPAAGQPPAAPMPVADFPLADPVPAADPDPLPPAIGPSAGSASAGAATAGPGHDTEPAAALSPATTPSAGSGRQAHAAADRSPGAGAGAAPERPWDVLLRLAAGDPAWRELAHPATLDVYDRYRLDEQVTLVVNDPVVGEEGGLTTTRDYRTYAEAFEASAQRKWDLVKRHVRPGRIVDVGCGAGAVLGLADREPALRESDLIGVEVARHLYEECVHRKAQGWFANPNVYFYCRNVLGGAVFPTRSIDTTLTFALTHEIWSYGDGMASLRAFAQAIYDHTVPGGVWINSDVCGPDNRACQVRLTLQGTPLQSPTGPALNTPPLAGSSPDATPETGTTPSGTVPSRAPRSAAASSGTAQNGSAPNDRASSGAAPSGTNRSGATLNGTAPSVTASSGTAPGDTAPSGPTSSGTAPSDTTPSGKAPSSATSSGKAPSGAASSGAVPGETMSIGTMLGGTAPSGTVPNCAASGATALGGSLAPSLDGLSRDEIAALVEGLSTRARLDRFAADFHFPLPYKDLEDSADPGAVEIALGDAMEFLTHKDYPDNWLSEAHEQFCGLEFADWKALLTDIGFEVDGASHSWRNDWIVDNRIRPYAQLSTVDGTPLDWPDTHVLLVARRPLNT
ncbi:hypothetical protein [Dactylosporangium sp. CA-233914]|uniref:hypothetical protein n=1 Tax=Dactylosporangium sp. CA-233914 TaxID=3239934 RepID=UPI003D928FA0